MAFELIPLPLSIIFILVFIGASLAVLWKLRRRGKVYSVLFTLAIVFLVAVLASAVYLFAFSPTRVGGGPVEIKIVPSQTSYSPSQQVHFQIFINNPHDWSIPYPTYVSYSLPQLADTGSIPTVPGQNSPFPPHSRTPLQTQALWTPSQPGNYTLTVTLHGIVNYGQPANYTFEVKPAP